MPPIPYRFLKGLLHHENSLCRDTARPSRRVLCFWSSILQCRHYAGGTASIDFHLMIRQIAESATGIGGGRGYRRGARSRVPALCRSFTARLIPLPDHFEWATASSPLSRHRSRGPDSIQSDLGSVSGGIPASGAVLTPKREWGEVTRKGAFAFARRTPVQSL
jgi:hypothetical protein